MTSDEDIASIAAQLADFTRTVGAMEERMTAISDRADSQQQPADRAYERSEAQQERIDIAARELAVVSERLQATAEALRKINPTI